MFEINLFWLVGYNLRDSMLIFWMFSLNYLIKFDYIIYKYLIELEYFVKID